MAMKQNEQNHQEQQQQQSHSLLLDALLCEEEKWEEDEGEVVQDALEEVTSENYKNDINGHNPACPSLFLLEQDLFWEDEELVSLFSKEEQQQTHFIKHLEDMGNEAAEHSLISVARREAVLWMLKVNAHYGFTALTAILAINYFDRFISSLHFQRDKPWMVQLVAVTCLSLAAKVEETQVPLLLDLQVRLAILNSKCWPLFSFLLIKFQNLTFGFCSVSGGGHKVCVWGQNDSKNGAFGALNSPMEDASSDPTFIPRPHHKEAWIENPSPLGVSQALWASSSLCGLW